MCGDIRKTGQGTSACVELLRPLCASWSMVPYTVQNGTSSFGNNVLLLHRRGADVAVLRGRNGGTQPWQDLLTHAGTLLHMRETRENELIDAQTPVGQEFASHLLWRPDNGSSTVNPYCRQTIPEMRADTMLGDTRGLCLLPYHRRANCDGLALLYHTGISMGDQAISGGPGGVRVIAHYQMGTQAKGDCAPTGLRLRRDALDACGDLLQGLDPHEIHFR